MAEEQLLVPSHYNVYLQDLSTDYLQLTLLGWVPTIDAARNMVKAFRESLFLENKNAVVFFEHEKES